MGATAAELIASFLVEKGLAVRPPGTGSQFPVTVGSMPSGGLDNYITVTDTGGELDGRLMGPGDTLNHPVFQVRVRSGKYKDAELKIQEIMESLSTDCRNESVAVNSETFVIKAVTITIAPGFIGQEEQEARQHFTLNGKLTRGV